MMRPPGTQSPTIFGNYRRSVALVSLTLLLLVSCAAAALARKVEQIETPGGVKAWLVVERSIPLIAVRFSFGGGALQDPSGMEGLAGMMASLLTEGAGDLTADVFARRVADEGAQISISSGRDQIHGGLNSLSKRFGPSAELLRLSLAKPRFDPRLRRTRSAAASERSRNCRERAEKHCVQSLVCRVVSCSTLRPADQWNAEIGAHDHPR